MSDYSQYDYIDDHFADFLEKVGIDRRLADGMSVAHGDKMHQYLSRWEEAGVPYYHGCLVCLLTRLQPYSQEVRNTPNGWVAPHQWVIDNYVKFKEHLPPLG